MIITYLKWLNGWRTIATDYSRILLKDIESEIVSLGHCIQTRVAINGTYKGHKWEHTDPINQESQIIHVCTVLHTECSFKPTIGIDPSTFSWTEGKFSCDCNRSTFLTKHMIERLEVDEDNCGDTIKIDSVVPLGDLAKIPGTCLYLNESSEEDHEQSNGLCRTPLSLL